MWTIWKLCFLMCFFAGLLNIYGMLGGNMFSFAAFFFVEGLALIWYSIHCEFIRKHCVNKNDLKKEEEW